MSTILILLIVQINGGYWICDWVYGRGWMFCTRGFCTTFGKKRSISIDNKQTDPIQHNDGIYCLDKTLCYTCEPIDDDACRIILQEQYFPLSDSYNKRADEDICS
jgi:hypothetical protein